MVTKVTLKTNKSIQDFAAQRNQLLKKVRDDWVFFVDSDEVVTPELEKEIQNLDPQYAGYYVKRQDFFFGRWLKHGETGNIKLVRIARKNAGKWAGKVHEVWKIRGKIGELKNPLKHYPHPSVSSFIFKINYYTDIAASEKTKFTLLEILIFPPAKFIQNYFLRLGFLDGTAGLVMAYLMSLHSLMVRVKKYDLLQNL